MVVISLKEGVGLQTSHKFQFTSGESVKTIRFCQWIKTKFVLVNGLKWKPNKKFSLVRTKSPIWFQIQKIWPNVLNFQFYEEI